MVMPVFYSMSVSTVYILALVFIILVSHRTTVLTELIKHSIANEMAWRSASG